MSDTKTCGVDGCERSAQASGLCPMHAARLRRRGDTGGAAKEHAGSYAGQVCSVEDCGKQPRSRGLCLAHYKRLVRWGDPRIKRPTVPAEERFRRRVVVGEAPAARPGLGRCHLWTAGRTKQGYGAFHPRSGQAELAHRWAYTNAGGVIPPDHVIDHLCRVRHCVNPDHMEPVTNEENLRRGAGYGLRNGMRRTCINDHEYTPANTYVSPSGDIRCRACARARDRDRPRPKKKAA